jgi:hypothetical protein
MKRAALAGVIALVSAAVATVGGRFALRPEPPSPPPSTSEPRRVRVPVADLDCPELPADLSDYLRDIRVETAMIEAESAGLELRRGLLGEDLPADLPESIQPDVVAEVVEALLPEGAEVLWQCDAIPCSGMVVLDAPDDAALDELAAFADALEREYPDAVAHEPLRIDDEGYAIGEGAAAAIHFQVLPTDLEEAHEARLYWLSRYARKMPLEAYRAGR